MAAEISEALGIDAVLIKGGKGIFDVEADGTLVFSKYNEKRFPNPDEVVGALRPLP